MRPRRDPRSAGGPGRPTGPQRPASPSRPPASRREPQPVIEEDEDDDGEQRPLERFDAGPSTGGDYGHRRPLITRRPGLDQLEGRNVVVEGLRAGRSLRIIQLDRGAVPKGSLLELLERAEQAGVTIEQVPRAVLDRATLTGTHQGVIAWAEPDGEDDLDELLDRLATEGTHPFLLLCDQVQYEQNLGAILRTAEAAGVHGVIVPRSHNALVTPVVRRISAGASEHLPVIRESTMAALKTLHKAGIPVIGADEHSELGFDEVDLTGPVTLLLGGEHKGLSEPVRERCDQLVSLPMRGKIPSLNVSVAAALLVYEKVRQERTKLRQGGGSKA